MEPPKRLPRKKRQGREDAHFWKEDRRLILEQRHAEELEQQVQALRRATGIRNREILAELAKHGLQPGMAACVRYVPLVAVAWADDRADRAETATILCMLAGEEAADRALLQKWLEQRPGNELLETWRLSITGLREELPQQELNHLRGGILSKARAVASASGSLFGLVHPVSVPEETLFHLINEAFESGTPQG